MYSFVLSLLGAVCITCSSPSTVNVTPYYRESPSFETFVWICYSRVSVIAPKMNPSVSQAQLTFHCDIIHRQLQALSSSHHLHRVPLVVVQLLSRKQNLRSFACSEGGGGFKSQTAQQEKCGHLLTHPHNAIHKVSSRGSGENLHVCKTHSRRQYGENERKQISGLTDCKNWCVLKSSQRCSWMSNHSKTAEEVD